MHLRRGCSLWPVPAPINPFVRYRVGGSFLRPLSALASCAVLALAASSAVAAEADCPVSDKEFLHQITSAHDWFDVHATYKHNLPACRDEGLYADGYTNMVVGVLAGNWGDLSTLQELAAKDEAFRAFVLRHIGTSAGEDDLRRVARRARADCPVNSARLCKEIAARCKAALGDKH